MHTRVDGPLKATGTATYAAEYHDGIGPNLVYGYVLALRSPRDAGEAPGLMAL